MGGADCGELCAVVGTVDLTLSSRELLLWPREIR